MGDYDTILVGGGLQSGLCALAILACRPTARLAIIERDPALGGNHTWCFHGGDLPAACRFAEPLVAHRWDGYDVVFPRRSRTLSSSYRCITSPHFDRVVRSAVAAAGGDVITSATATDLAPRSVTLADGRRLGARAIIDARGPSSVTAAAGFQKFFGLELSLHGPHHLRRPVLMDAAVPQRDGFRFFYVLPLSADRVLVEDTYFSTSAELDVERLRDEVLRYAASRGMRVGEAVRSERGVLPMPWTGPSTPSLGAPLVAGYRGGWFHPATGYSLPVAARLARAIALDGPGRLPGPSVRALARRIAQQGRFARLLNRLAFRWFADESRWHVFERFYGLPEATIRRFYALDTTATDRARILLGRPPEGMSLRARLARRTEEAA